MYENKGMELNYEMLLLNHLNRISHLSTFVAGEMITNHGQTLSKEDDKRLAFMWSVRLMECFVPEELWDKKYIDEIKMYTEEKSLSKSFKLGEWTGRLQCSVNLLARKGFLFETKAVGRVIKEISKKTKELKEEWDK